MQWKAGQRHEIPTSTLKQHAKAARPTKITVANTACRAPAQTFVEVEPVLGLVPILGAARHLSFAIDRGNLQQKLARLALYSSLIYRTIQQEHLVA